MARVIVTQLSHYDHEQLFVNGLDAAVKDSSDSKVFPPGVLRALFEKRVISYVGE